MNTLLRLLAKRLTEKSDYVHMEIRAQDDEVLDSFNVPREVILQAEAPVIHEWQEISVWMDDISSLANYEKDGWEIFQFVGNVMFEGRVIGKSVVMKRKIQNPLA